MHLQFSDKAETDSEALGESFGRKCESDDPIRQIPTASTLLSEQGITQIFYLHFAMISLLYCSGYSTLSSFRDIAAHV